MPSLNHVKVNIDPQKKLLYEAQAAQQNKSLSAYLRDKLEDTQNIKQELSALKLMLQRDSIKEHLSPVKLMLQKLEQKIEQKRIASSSAVSSPFVSAFSLEDRGIQLETLLLLRCIVNPGDLRMIQSELKRQKIPVWDGIQESRS